MAGSSPRGSLRSGGDGLRGRTGSDTPAGGASDDQGDAVVDMAKSAADAPQQALTAAGFIR
jgi:hypothetical protein